MKKTGEKILRGGRVRKKRRRKTGVNKKMTSGRRRRKKTRRGRGIADIKNDVFALI